MQLAMRVAAQELRMEFAFERGLLMLGGHEAQPCVV
jgi:hypothetical protein